MDNGGTTISNGNGVNNMKEVVITEHLYTKMVSYIIESSIVIAFYTRYSTNDKWELANDYSVSMEEFEYIKDTINYLATMYNHEIKQVRQ